MCLLTVSIGGKPIANLARQYTIYYHALHNQLGDTMGADHNITHTHHSTKELLRHPYQRTFHVVTSRILYLQINTPVQYGTPEHPKSTILLLSIAGCRGMWNVYCTATNGFASTDFCFVRLRCFVIRSFANTFFAFTF
jgi:hypothetical protein